MKIALVDDDQEMARRLVAHLSTALTKRGIRDHQIRCFHGSTDFFESWRSGIYDIILLDIYMDEMNGVDIARRIRQSDENVVLVFCTSSNEFAVQSYEVNARYYLQKPVSQEKIEQMLARIDLARIESARSIVLPNGFRILLRRLIYTNYANHVVTFHLHGQDPHSIYISQAQVEQMLDLPGFYTANKGSIVNFAMVKRINAEGFLMKNGELVPIARRRFKDAQEAYTRFHFQSLCEEAEEA